MKKHVLFLAVVIVYMSTAMGQSPNFLPNHDIVLCGPNDVFFVCTSPEYPDHIWWDFGDGSTGTGINPSHRYVTSGSFDVKMVVEVNGIKDSIVKADFIVIHPVPEASFTVEKTPLSEPFKRRFVFDGFANADSMTNYTWKINDSIVSTQPVFSYLFNGNDHYFVSLDVTNDRGCSDHVADSITIFDEPVVAMGLADSKAKQPYSMGYNMDDATVMIHREMNSGLRADVRIYDITGNLVQHSILQADQQGVVMNLGALPVGMYIMSVNDTAHSFVKRLVKPI